MRIRKSGSCVLWYECLGFGMLLVLSWVNELVNLSHRLLGEELRPADWRDSALQSVVILLIWWMVFALTRRLMAHLHYLEGFLRVCAWCRKVGQGEEWMRLEDYFARGFQIETTHGMCPECLKKMEEDTKEFHRQRLESEAKAA